MSLGDYLRLLRARKGGVTPWDIETATPALPKGLYRQMEQRYRSMGDPEAVQMLADFYGVPFEDLIWRLEWPRKALSRALSASLAGLAVSFGSAFMICSATCNEAQDELYTFFGLELGLFGVLFFSALIGLLFLGRLKRLIKGGNRTAIGLDKGFGILLVGISPASAQLSVKARVIFLLWR